MRFAVILRRIARSVGITPEELCGRFIPYPKGDWFTEDNLLDAIHNMKYLNHCYADIDMYGYPLYFDVLRLSYSNLSVLIKRICEHDCYGLKDLAIGEPVVIDAGAHIGIFSRYVLKEHPNATVYAFEPDLEIINLLRMNLKGFNAAYIFQKAILDKKDYLDFYISSRIDWRSTLIIDLDSDYAKRFEKGEMRSSYKVEATNVDSFVLENSIPKVDFIKITVGPYEHLVLNGAAETIVNYRPQIAMLAYNENKEKVEDFFKRVGGYRKPRPYIPPEGPPPDIIVFQPF